MANNAYGMTCLTDLSKQLKTVDKAFARAVTKQLNAAVAAAGADLVAKVQSNAFAQGLHRAAGAVKITTRKSTKGASVRVQVDKSKAPYARPLESGNKTQYSEAFIQSHGGYKTVNGRRVAVDRKVYKRARAAGASQRVLVHPVFDYPLSYASRVTAQATRPFFFPAIDAAGPGMDAKFEAAVIAMAKEAGFK
jgi:hypothetical protein